MTKKRRCVSLLKKFEDKPIVWNRLTEHDIVHLDKPQVVLSKRSYYQLVEVLFAALLKC